MFTSLCKNQPLLAHALCSLDYWQRELLTSLYCRCKIPGFTKLSTEPLHKCCLRLKTQKKCTRFVSISWKRRNSSPQLQLPHPPPLLFPSPPVQVRVGISLGFPSGPRSAQALPVRKCLELRAQLEIDHWSTLMLSSAPASPSCSVIFPGWQTAERIPGNRLTEWQVLCFSAAAVWRKTQPPFSDSSR